MALRADVAGVDPVLGQGRGHLRVVHEQLVAVVVEVADDRHVDAEAPDLADHLRHGGGRFVRVDRHADELRTGVRQPCDLDGGRVRVGRIRVGHRLDDDRVGAPTSTPPTSTLTVARRRGRSASGALIGPYEPPARLRMMSKPVTQMRKREEEDEADHVGQLLRPEADPRAEHPLEGDHQHPTAVQRRERAGC